MRRVVLVLALFSLAIVPTASAAIVEAYSVPVIQVGNQAYGGTLGLQFTVGSTPIMIDRYGVFDDSVNSIGAGTLSVAIFDIAGNIVAGSPTVTFTTNSPGTPLLNHLFKSLASNLVLTAGTYAVGAWGFSTTNPNANSACVTPGTAGCLAAGGAWTAPTLTNGGVITFGPQSLYDAAPGSLAAASTYGGAAEWHAGTFSFRPVPEPSTYALVGLGLAGLAIFRRRQKA